MKKQTLSLIYSGILFCLFLSSNLFAQEETEYLLDGKLSFSGFGGPITEFSSINNDLAVSSGGGGALIINRSFFFGGYGLGLTSEVDYPINANESIKTNLSHGGFWLGGIIKPSKLIHFGVSSKLGWGSLSSRDFNGVITTNFIRGDDVFVVTPQVEVEMNVARWFKINVGGGFRKVVGIEEGIYNKTDFDSGVVTLNFLFGWFR